MHRRRYVIIALLVVVIVGGVIVFWWRQKKTADVLDIWSILPEQTLLFVRVTDITDFQKFCAFPLSQIQIGVGLDSITLRRLCEGIETLEQFSDFRKSTIYLVFAGQPEKPELFLVVDAGKMVKWHSFQEYIIAISEKTNMSYILRPEQMQVKLHTAEDTLYIDVLQNLFICALQPRAADVFTRRTGQPAIDRIVNLSDSLKHAEDNHLCEIYIFRFRNLVHHFVPDVLITKNDVLSDTMVLVIENKPGDVLRFRFISAGGQRLFEDYIDRRGYMLISLLRTELAYRKRINISGVSGDGLFRNIFDTVGLHVMLDPLISGGNRAEVFVFRLLSEQRFMRNSERLTIQELKPGFLGFEQSVYVLRPEVARQFPFVIGSDIFLTIIDSLGVFTTNMEVLIHLLLRRWLLDAHNQNISFPVLQTIQFYPYLLLSENQNLREFYSTGFSGFHHFANWYVDDAFSIHIETDSNSLLAYFTSIAQQWLQLAEAVLSRVEQIWSEAAIRTRHEKDGFSTLWAQDSSYYLAGNVKSGKMYGIWRMYDSVGRVLLFQEFKDGRGQGQCGVYMYAPGQRFFLMCVQQDGKVRSNVILFYPDGRLACVVPYGKHGAEGVAKVYYRTGSLMCEWDCEKRQILSVYNVEGDLIIGQDIYRPGRMLRNYELLR